MKKILPFLFLFLAAVFIISCASGAQTTATEPVAEEPVAMEDEPETPAPAPVTSGAKRDKTGIIIEGATQYKVKNGDTLSNIAKKQYGTSNGYYFPLILMASDNSIKDPDVIITNGNLIIPDLKANLNDSESRAKMKTFFATIAESYKGKTTPGAAKLREEINKISNSL